MSAPVIRDDISSEELRGRPGRERDGRVSARPSRLPTRSTGWTGASAARLAGWIADLARLDAPLQRRRACRAVRPTEAGRLPKLSDGDRQPESDCPGRPDPAKHHVRRCGSSICVGMSRSCWAVSYSETGMLRLLWSLTSHRKTRPRHPQSDEKAPSSLQKTVFPACLNEIAATHPEAQRFEIWSQDEARVVAKQRLAIGCIPPAESMRAPAEPHARTDGNWKLPARTRASCAKYMARRAARPSRRLQTQRLGRSELPPDGTAVDHSTSLLFTRVDGAVGNCYRPTARIRSVPIPARSPRALATYRSSSRPWILHSTLIDDNV